MNEINLRIDLPPKGKMRPRITTRNGKTRNIKSEKQLDYERKFLWLLKGQDKPKKPIGGVGVELEIKAYMPIQKGISLTQRYLIDTGFAKHIVKPDADNITKNVKDILTKAGYWKDDNLVYKETTEKIYSKRPRIEIKIRW